MPKAPEFPAFCEKSLGALRRFSNANFPARPTSFRFVEGRFPGGHIDAFQAGNGIMSTLIGRASIYAHVADGARDDFREMREVLKEPEFAPFRGNSYGRFGALLTPHLPEFSRFLLAEGGSSEAFSVRLRLQPVLICRRRRDFRHLRGNR